MNNHFNRGITLIETLLIISIIGILAAIVLPGFARIKKVQILKSTTEEIVSVLEKARSQTLASLNSSSYGVHFETNKVIIFTGTSFVSDDVNNQIINIMLPATISNINLNNASTFLYFNRLSGIPSTSGNITVSVPDIPSKVINISATGSASIN